MDDPLWHVPLAMHQPQPAAAAHDAHVVFVEQVSAGHETELQDHGAPLHEAPEVDPEEVPVWQLRVVLHQPHALWDVHARQVGLAETQASLGQADADQLHRGDAQVGPTVECVELPLWHRPLALHQPHPERAAQAEQVPLEAQGSAAHTLVVQNQFAPVHVAPTDDPVVLPLWQVPDVEHQPQPECPEHVAQFVFDAHGSAAHALVDQNQLGPVHVPPSVCPVPLPLTHECELAHQPQPARAAHVPQSVLDAHGSVMHAVVVQNHDAAAHVPAAGPVDVPDVHCPVPEHQPQPPRAAHVAQFVLDAQVSGGVAQVPVVQTCPLGHAWPQVPQLPRSVCVLTHAMAAPEPQGARGVEQRSVHALATQVCAPGHTVPHAPQLL